MHGLSVAIFASTSFVSLFYLIEKFISLWRKQTYLPKSAKFAWNLLIGERNGKKIGIMLFTVVKDAGEQKKLPHNFFKLCI